MRLRSLLILAILALYLSTSEVLGKKKNGVVKASPANQPGEEDVPDAPEAGSTAPTVSKKVQAHRMDVTTTKPPIMQNKTLKASRKSTRNGTAGASSRSLVGDSNSNTFNKQKQIVTIETETIVHEQQRHQQSVNQHARQLEEERLRSANSDLSVNTHHGRIILNKNADYFPACVDYLPSDACRTLKPLCSVSDTAKAIRYLRERSDYILYLTKDIQKHIENVKSTLPQSRNSLNYEANLNIQRELENIKNLLPSVKKTAPLIRLILDEDSEDELERIINAHLRFKKECSVHQEMCYKTHVSAHRRKKACELYDSVCCCDGYKFQRYYQSLKKTEVRQESKECKAMRHSARRMIEASCAATCGTCPTRYRINEYAQNMLKAFDCNHLKIPRGQDLRIHFQKHPYGESFRDEMVLKRYRDSNEDMELGADRSSEAFRSDASDDTQVRSNYDQPGLSKIFGRRRKCAKRHNQVDNDGGLDGGYGFDDAEFNYKYNHANNYDEANFGHDSVWVEGHQPVNKFEQQPGSQQGGGSYEYGTSNLQPQYPHGLPLPVLPPPGFGDNAGDPNLQPVQGYRYEYGYNQRQPV